MNAFVKKCRREWKRLRVPEATANEMAAELEADLKEAEAEGASPEDVLGTAVFDARAFARSWAAERGVIPSPHTSKAHLNGRTPFVVAGVALAVIAALGAGMVIASSVGSSRLVAFAAGPVTIDAPACVRLILPATPPVEKNCVGPEQRTQIIRKGPATIEIHRPGFTQTIHPQHPAQVIPPSQGPAGIERPVREVIGPPLVPRAFMSDVSGTRRLWTLGWILFIGGAGGLILLSVLSWFQGHRQRRTPVPV